MSPLSFLVNAFVIAIALMAAFAQAATQIIVPLYAYPTDQEWSIVQSSLAEYPNIDFLLIINPSNGPETSNPNSDWTSGIAKLRAHSNVHILGYIDTQFSGRDVSDVECDISTYAAWPAASRVDGIFLDEVSQNDVSYYQSL